MPEWVPVEPWETWIEIRTKLKVPNTERALLLAVKKLEELRTAGHDPRVVLELAALRGWRGLFAPRPDNGSGGEPTVAHAATRLADLGNCACGKRATMKIGSHPRCDEHARGLPAGLKDTR